MKISIISAIVLIILSVLTDLYILSDIKNYNGSRKFSKWAKIYCVISVAFWIYLIVIFCLPRNNQDKSIVPVMWMLFSYLSVYVSKIIYCLISLIGRFFKSLLKTRENYGVYFGTAAGVAVCAMMWIGTYHTRHNIDITNVEVSSDKLPASFDGMKVAHFTDLHLGTWGNDTTFISWLVEKINGTNPDIIVFTGDYVNRKGDEMKPFLDILSRLKAPYGVYAVFGNHDYGDYVKWKNQADDKQNFSDLQSDIAGMNWKMLNNSSVFLKSGLDSIALIGVHNWGEPPFKGLGDLKKAYPLKGDTVHNLKDGMYKILLTHNPEHWNRIATKISNIDLSLSGHTHAMQTMFKFGDKKWSPAAIRYKYWGGLYDKTASDGNKMNLYVNIGAGEVGFPARLGAAKPEITLITLRSSEKSK